MDTSFLLALQDRRDQYHAQALDLATRYEGLPLLLTEAILLEVGNALARGRKAEAENGDAVCRLNRRVASVRTQDRPVTATSRRRPPSSPTRSSVLPR